MGVSVNGHQGILDRIYFCNNCKAVFLFQADVEYHNMTSGHSSIKTLSFDEYYNKN